MEINPFYLTNVIPDAFFCDRTEETGKMIKAIKNQENVVLTAQRRVGKTGLINHCFANENIRKDYLTISIDILHTSSLCEFVQELGNATFKSIAKKSARLSKKFAAALKSLTASFGYDSLTGGPTFDVKLGEISQPSFTLDEILEYLESAGKPVVVAIDEFQQICYYQEKNVEELLRGKIQKLQNTHFIFSGSSRRLMSRMFFSAKHAFYQSATPIELDIIDREAYILFSVDKFKDSGRLIDRDAVEYAYDRFRGITLHTHRVLHDAFASTENNGICKLKDMICISDTYIEESGTRIKEIVRSVSPGQKELLYAICNEGNATGITSAAFIKKHCLKSASAVQSAAKCLLAADMISKVGNTYSISDQLIEIWLKEKL